MQDKYCCSLEKGNTTMKEECETLSAAIANFEAKVDQFTTDRENFLARLDSAFDAALAELNDQKGDVAPAAGTPKKETCN
jgi:hypothetical protein